MNTSKQLHGAALISHNLKAYGNGHMKDGLRRLAQESGHEGFCRGLQYAIDNINQIVQQFIQYRWR